MDETGTSPAVGGTLPPRCGRGAAAYLLTWVERGISHATHHCHVLRFDLDGRFARDQFFCGGRWDAGLLAEMASADNAG
ncbi:MAG TPA: hypothetical protein VFZ97_13820 [Acidimicrobiales bacterium]